MSVGIAVRALLTSLILTGAFFLLGIIVSNSEDAADKKWLNVASAGVTVFGILDVVCLIAVVWLR